MNTLKISDLAIFGFLAAAALAGYFMGANAMVVLFGGLLLVLSISFLIMKSQSTEKIIRLNVQTGEDDKKYVKKYKEADVGRFTSIFLFTGLSISILSSIYAFDLTILEPEVVDLSTKTIIDEDDFEIIPPTLKNEKEKVKVIPKVKEPEPEIELDKDPVLEIVDDAELLEKNEPKIQDKAIDIDQKVSEKVVEEVLGDLDDLLKDLEEEKEAETEDPVFMVVEDQPSFIGGEAELFKFIYKNIKYPSIAKENGITGKCYVSFVIEKDGSVSDVKIVKDIGGGCGEEAVRVINMMPKWSPGKQRGNAVRVAFNLPVSFALK